MTAPTKESFKPTNSAIVENIDAELLDKQLNYLCDVIAEYEDSSPRTVEMLTGILNMCGVILDQVMPPEEQSIV